MKGHGTFIYRPDYTIQSFGSAQGVAEKLKELGMSYAWLRVHNKNGSWRTDDNLQIARALKEAGIQVGVWGWNDGNNVSQDIANAKKAIETYQPYAYIADIEPGVSEASWNTSDAKIFAEAVKSHLGERKLVVSSFGYIKVHQPELMRSIDDIVDVFAPQVYWFWHPKRYMLPANDPFLSSLPTNNASAYAKVCLKVWRDYVTKPLILTGQAYWGEATNWTQSKAERKLEEFVAGFDSYDQILGINWWNLADPKAMSNKMMLIIKNADFKSKFTNSTFSELPNDGLIVDVDMDSEDSNHSATFQMDNKRYIAAEGLNFRSEPDRNNEANIIGVLSFGDVAHTIGEITSNGYQKVLVELDGEQTTGYLSSRYLRNPETEEIERVVQEAVDEWHRFQKGRGIETIEPYSSYINEMWTARGYPDITGQDTDWFWSAAFISFVLENADYSRTKFDIRHSTYINEAIQNRITNSNRDFFGYRITEAKPQVGDIICQWRQYETTYDSAETQSRFPSHTDLVIAVRDRSIVTLGGNVTNPTSDDRGVTVGTKIFSLNSAGFLPGNRRVFAIMKNNYRPRTEQELVE